MSGYLFVFRIFRADHDDDDDDDDDDGDLELSEHVCISISRIGGNQLPVVVVSEAGAGGSGARKSNSRRVDHQQATQ